MLVRAHSLRTAARRARGFTLIEVLVTILVVSIGLLGLAALQTTGLKFNQTAYLRSQATILAESMMDSLRADRDEALEEDYDIELASDPPGGGDTPSRVLGDWRTAIDDTLPERPGNAASAGDGSVPASGSVDVNPATGDVTIVVAWGERNDDADSPLDERRFTFNSRL